MLRCSECGRQLKKGEVCQCSVNSVTISESSRHLGGLKIIIALIALVGIAGCVMLVVFLGKGQNGESSLGEDAANEAYSVTENEKDTQSESAEEQTEESTLQAEEQTEESTLHILQAKYQAGELEYIEARQGLNEIDTVSLEGKDVDIFLELSKSIEQKLTETAKMYAEADEYENLFVYLEEILREVPKDNVALELRESYKIDCLRYLEEKSVSLMEKGYKKKARSLLQEAIVYYPDPDDIQELLDELNKQIQEKEEEEKEKETESVLEKDYIFENSDSSYLKESDLENMSIKEINYAKNEIYARHGRTFQSKELQEYFNSKKWYQELDKIDWKEFDAHPDKYQLNDYELKNAVLLKNKEFSMDSKGYQLDQ